MTHQGQHEYTISCVRKWMLGYVVGCIQQYCLLAHLLLLKHMLAHLVFAEAQAVDYMHCL